MRSASPIPFARVLGLALVLVASSACDGGGSGVAAEVSPRLRVEGRWLVDADGGVRILRGANVSGRAKGPPFIALEDPRGFDQVAAWGFGVVRLLTSWEAIEPEPGVFDTAYLERYVALVREAEARGLQVLVDMHQDLWSRAFCGDGAPRWALPDDVEPFPPEACGPGWFAYQFTPAVARAVDHFWESDALRGHYRGAVVEVARRLRDEPAVVGYDLMNEPIGYSAILGQPDYERDRLEPFYRDVAAAIRAVDPAALVFLEPTGAAGVGFGSFLEPLGAPGAVLAAHCYDPIQATLGVYLGTKDARERRYGEIVDFAASIGMAPFIGEWGVYESVPDKSEALADEISIHDRWMLSGTIWNYEPTGYDWNGEGGSIVEAGGAERPFMDVLVRPYPWRIAGEPVRYGYDPASGVFELVFRERAGARGETVVFVPERRYPSGPVVSVSDGSAALEQVAGGWLVRWRASAAGAAEHTLRLSR